MFDTILYGFLAGILLTILVRLIATVVMMWKLNGIVMVPHLVVLFLMLLFASCTKDDVYPNTCLGGDCNASFDIRYPLDENGYYHVVLDYSGSYYPRFNVDVYVNPTNSHYWYNETSVVSVEFTGNKYIQLPMERVPVVQETLLYLSGTEKLYTKRIIGPIPPQIKGDTLSVNVEVYWDAGDQSVYKNYFLKFILE